jgi:hypothetical protein
MDPTLEAAQKLRAYEEKHPWQALSGGFIPGVGQAQSAAALRDPKAPWWEKALSVPGLIPGLGGVAKAGLIGVKLAKGTKHLEQGADAARKAANYMLHLKFPRAIPDTNGSRKLLIAQHPEMNDELARKFGWFIEPWSGKLVTEIDDSASKINLGQLQQAEGLHHFGKPGQELSAADVLHHPEYQKIPAARDFMERLGVQMDRNLKDAHGEFDPAMHRITLQPDLTVANEKKLHDLMIHEPNHAVAAHEGLPGGTSVEAAGSYENYLRDPGEVNARVDAMRRFFTPEGRKKFPFHKHVEAENARLRYDPSNYGGTQAELSMFFKERNLDPEDWLTRPL